MASSIGVILILLGAFIMAVGYQMVSDCQTRFINSNCWDPFLRDAGGGALGFYIGAIIAILGAIILVGPRIAGLLGKTRGTEPDAKE